MQGPKIKIEDLPFHTAGITYMASDDKSLSALEKKHISIVLQENGWNISKSADILGIDRVTLYNKINKYGLQKPL